MMISLSKYPYIGYDTETTGLVYPQDRVFGFSIAAPDGNTWYYDIRQEPKAIDWFNDEVSKYKGHIVCHNVSFDYRFSQISGLYPPLGQMTDTVIRACLIDEHLNSYDLDSLAKKYLDSEKEKSIYQELASIFGGLATRNVQMKNLQFAEPSVVAPYAKQDALICLRLYENQEDMIEQQSESVPLQMIIDFEQKLMPIVIENEIHGIRVDLSLAEEAADRLTPIIEEQRKKLDDIAGWEVNVNSGPQIKNIFEPTEDHGEWVANDGTILGKTPNGGPSIGAPILRRMSHPAAALILDIRSTIKTRDTFLRGHVLKHAHGDRVYPNINQSKGEDGGTGTGRFSYTNPALQQIPSRNKAVAAIVKPCFLPDDDHIWVDADMDSFEVRVFAHLVGDSNIVSAYKKTPDLDLHQYVADLTGLTRDATYAGQANAKQLNLSMIFNSGNGAIAETMGMDWSWNEFTDKNGKQVRYKQAGEKALRIIDNYHRRIPGVRKLADNCRKVAESRGYIRTYAGRRIRFPRGWKSYKASGLLIQATSAELNKENWIMIQEELNGAGRMVLNTHDSYGMSLPERDWKEHFARVKSRIETSRLKVPLILGLSGSGRNWWEAISGDKSRGDAKHQ